MLLVKPVILVNLVNLVKLAILVKLVVLVKLTILVNLENLMILVNLMNLFEKFQIFGNFSDFRKTNPRDLWPDTWYLRHWLHFWQLRTTIWTITLWPLNIEWWWQHSQFLRCFHFVNTVPSSAIYFDHSHFVNMVLYPVQLSYPLVSMVSPCIVAKVVSITDPSRVCPRQVNLWKQCESTFSKEKKMW